MKKKSETLLNKIMTGAISLLLCGVLATPALADQPAWLACIADCNARFATAAGLCGATRTAADDATAAANAACKAVCAATAQTGFDGCLAARNAADAISAATYGSALITCLGTWVASYAAAAALTDEETKQAIRAAADDAKTHCDGDAAGAKNAAELAALLVQILCNIVYSNAKVECDDVCDAVADAELAANATAYAVCLGNAEVAKAACVTACVADPGS